MLRQDVSPALHSSLPTGKPVSDVNTGPALCQSSQEPAEPLDRILSMLENILRQGPQQAQYYDRPERQSPGTECEPRCHVKCVGTGGTLLVFIVGPTISVSSVMLLATHVLIVQSQ